MVDSLRGNAFFQQLETEHRNWLSGFNKQHLRNWEKVLNQNEEAAFAEARFRQLLESWSIRVEPNEDFNGKSPRPDFRCYRENSKFYVEITCIPIEVAAVKTGISIAPHGCMPYRPLNDAIFYKCWNKERKKQCENLDAPVLVAIGTFHSRAAALSFVKSNLNMLLTGEGMIAWDIDSRTGLAGDTYDFTELKFATFLDWDKTNKENEEPVFVRSSISGLLLCNLSSERWRPIGILHPNPVHPFDPKILPQIEFGRVAIDKASRQLLVEWPGGHE